MTADSYSRGSRQGKHQSRRKRQRVNDVSIHTSAPLLVLMYILALMTVILPPAGVNSSTVSSTPAASKPPPHSPAPTNNNNNNNGSDLIDVGDNHGGDDDEHHHESIIFEGTFECQSKDVVTLPKHCTREELMEFFRDRTNRDVLLKGGGNQVDPISLTQNIFNEWTKRTKLEHATPPGDQRHRRRHHHHRNSHYQDQQQQESDGGNTDSKKATTRKSSVGRLLHRTDRGGSSFGLMKLKNNMNSGSTTNSGSVDTGPDMDTEDEEVLAIHSDAPICPGLRVDAVSYTGCKLSVDTKTSMPQYEFTLLHDTYKAKGQKPIVWVFDKITGANSNSNGSGGGSSSSSGGEKNSSSHSKEQVKTGRVKAVAMDPVLQGASLIGNIDAAVGDHGGSRKTFALTRVTLHPEDGQQHASSSGSSRSSFRGGSFWGGRGRTVDNNSSIVGRQQGQITGRRCRVTYYGHVKVECSLPRSFLGFLPVPKHKMEERVSKSIVSQLEKEGIQSVDQFAERLSKWSQMKDSSN